MKTKVTQMSIGQLRDTYHTISYPEFQRESNIWNLDKKVLLIDSILRDFDIGSIYFIDEAEEYQCIDGRQRLAAIFSFLGVNISDKHNSFAFIPSNEVKTDTRLNDIVNATFQDEAFAMHRDRFLRHEITIVKILEVDEETDLNLQFQRLQNAQVLNAAEKLNAMVGEMRDAIFRDDGLGSHPYFLQVKMPKGRFGTKQSASQVAINAVSINKSTTWNEGFARARFLDMQEFFMSNFKMPPVARKTIREIRERADELVTKLNPETFGRIRNRALVVSILLFYFVEKKDSEIEEDQWGLFDAFLQQVFDSLGMVSKKRLDSAAGPWERLQLAITQASVEKSAILTRHLILADQFRAYLREQRPNRKV